MALTYTPICDTNFKAPDFKLQGIDGKSHTLNELKGPNGLLIVFMCNHCPYVKAIIKKLNHDAKQIISQGIGVIGINANDEKQYPDDSFENMIKFAKYYDLIFPYLHDESQTVARSYGGVCTPDFFGFNKDLMLRYRGRFDDAGMSDKEDTTRELLIAMKEVAQTGNCTVKQTPSMGCNIKYRD